MSAEQESKMEVSSREFRRGSTNELYKRIVALRGDDRLVMIEKDLHTGPRRGNEGNSWSRWIDSFMLRLMMKPARAGGTPQLNIYIWEYYGLHKNKKSRVFRNATTEAALYTHRLAQAHISPDEVLDMYAKHIGEVPPLLDEILDTYGTHRWHALWLTILCYPGLVHFPKILDELSATDARGGRHKYVVDPHISQHLRVRSARGVIESLVGKRRYSDELLAAIQEGGTTTMLAARLLRGIVPDEQLAQAARDYAPETYKAPDTHATRAFRKLLLSLDDPSKLAPALADLSSPYDVSTSIKRGKLIAAGEVIESYQLPQVWKQNSSLSTLSDALSAFAKLCDFGSTSLLAPTPDPILMTLPAEHANLTAFTESWTSSEGFTLEEAASGRDIWNSPDLKPHLMRANAGEVGIVHVVHPAKGRVGVALINDEGEVEVLRKYNRKPFTARVQRTLTQEIRTGFRIYQYQTAPQ